jgi:hypothetical protein
MKDEGGVEGGRRAESGDRRPEVGLCFSISVAAEPRWRVAGGEWRGTERLRDEGTKRRRD